MPTSQQILDGLAAIANSRRALAVLWHVAFGVGISAFLLGWRPRRQLAGVLLALPLVSVSALAWLTGNPFNGTVFLLLAAALAWQAIRLPQARVGTGGTWLLAAGTLLTAFGWIYPHFLETDTWTTYLYAAPLGLVPCPTLSALVGMAMIFDGLGSRGWPMTLASVGAIYGLIGWLRLGVTIDLVLLAGAAVLGIAAFRAERSVQASVEGA
jgi:hypothetical protein